MSSSVEKFSSFVGFVTHERNECVSFLDSEVEAEVCSCLMVQSVRALHRNRRAYIYIIEFFATAPG